MQTFKLDRKFVVCLITAFITGILAHGMKMFNFMSFHDDIFCTFFFGSTVFYGRWGLKLIWEFMKWLWRGSAYNEPVLNAAVSLLFLAAASWITVKLFEIRNEIIIVLVTALVVVFPATTSMFCYMFTAPCYSLSVFLCALAAYLLLKGFRGKNSWQSVVMSILIAVFGMAVYQAYFAITTSLILLYLIYKLLQDGTVSWKKYFSQNFLYLLILIADVLLYSASTKVFARIFHVTLDDYAGISSMGITGPAGYLKRILSAYYRFFIPSVHKWDSMFPQSMRRVYVLTLAIALVLTVVLVINHKNARFSLQYLILFFLIPLASNLTVVMTENLGRGLAMYGQLLPFFYILILVSMSAIKWEKLDLHKGVYLWTALIIVLYLRWDNAVYLKESFLLSETDRIYTTLITRIQSAPDYDDDLPVLYIGERQMNDKTYKMRDELASIILDPVDEMILNDYAWKEYMELILGFSPALAEVDDSFYQKDEIQSMGTYPDDNSIRVIDGIVVVKFADEP